MVYPDEIDFTIPRDGIARRLVFPVEIWFKEEIFNYSVSLSIDDNYDAIVDELITLMPYNEEKYWKYHEKDEFLSTVNRNQWYILSWDYYYTTLPKVEFTITYDLANETGKTFSFTIDQDGGVEY